MNHLYHDVLGRSADPVGQLAWTQALAAGVDPVTLAGQLLANPESLQLDVQGLYEQYLRRAADPRGEQSLLTALTQGLPEPLAEVFLVASEEWLALWQT